MPKRACVMNRHRRLSNKPPSTSRWSVLGDRYRGQHGGHVGRILGRALKLSSSNNRCFSARLSPLHSLSLMSWSMEPLGAACKRAVGEVGGLRRREAV